ncbi:MAG TPA: dTMP kinase, partial [Saprospiraceae bacterium]|nr:dTMP kinase [Saprospiraceae bacterium]
MSKPLFIVIEGIDGSGKSTQIELLYKAFNNHGQSAITTHEPTDGKIGLMIRDIMSGKVSADPAVIAALYLADRLDHITHPDTGMLAILEEGHNIIASRYYFSTYAFQGEYLPLSWLIQTNNLCKSYLKADITFYINIDPEICYQRLTKTRDSLDIYENRSKLKRTH